MWGVSGLAVQNKSLFARMNPFVNFVYFAGIMVFTVCVQHPAVLLTGAVASFVYSIYLVGASQLIFNIKLLFLIVLTTILNPLFNHQGATILFYLNENPVTKEAIVYGFAAGVMLYDMLLEFSIFNKIMTSDKIICVLSHTVPVFALLFTISLRFVPMYRAQLKKIRAAQKGVGCDTSQGNVLDRIIHGIEILSGLITWALENALETSDSMKARGFGLRGRTYYTNSRFTRLDKQMAAVELLLLTVAGLAVYHGSFHAVYFPEISIQPVFGKEKILYVAYLIFTLLPLMIDIKEEMVWHLSISRM